MQTVLDKFGRIVIPKKTRDNFGLRPGSPIRIEEGKNEILLKPIEGDPSLIEKEGVLVYTGRAVGDLEAGVDEFRRERSRSLGGSK